MDTTLRRPFAHLGTRLRSLPPWVVALGLFVVFVAVRWPLRAAFLVNWDAANFALGIDAFHLEHHQPHPPGYIGYIVLARAVTALLGDPNAAMTAISCVAGGVLPALLFLLARRLLSGRVALLTAVLVGTSPLVWYYSVVALTYVVSAALAVGILLAAHVARHDGSRRALYTAAVLTALLGAIRQTDLLFVLPVLVWAAWPYTWRVRLRGAAVLAGVTAAWLVPLLVLAGGPLRYLELSRALASLAGGRTWVLGLDPVGLGQNLLLVGLGLLLGLNVMLLALLAAPFRRVRPWRRLAHDDRRLLLLLTVPALTVFLLVHTGQIGYVLMILPAAGLAAGSAIDGLVEAAGDRRAARLPRRPAGSAPLPAGMGRLGWVAVLAVVVNAAGFFAYPSAARSFVVERGPVVSDGDSAHARAAAQEVGPRTRQFDLANNDAYWRDLIDAIEDHDPASTAVLTGADSAGAFRHLAVYTPDHRVYAVGRDLHGDVGHLFRAHEGETDYTVDGLDRSTRTLVLPTSIDTLIVPDLRLQEMLEDADVIEETAVAAVVRVPPGAHVVVHDDRDDTDDDPWIRVEAP